MEYFRIYYYRDPFIEKTKEKYHLNISYYIEYSDAIFIFHEIFYGITFLTPLKEVSSSKLAIRSDDTNL